MQHDRRSLLKFLSLSLAGLASGCGVLKQRNPSRQRVIVVGAGFGGATAAKYLRLFYPEIEVVVIEPKKQLITCPFSNTVIAGINDISAISHSYQPLQLNHQIHLIQGAVSTIDPEKQQLWLEDGQRLFYDRLILSPGISMRWNELEGYDAAASQIMPHAWQAGEQTLLLRRQLQALRTGGLVVISAPANPFRCPPGPYERAGLMAHYLKQHNPSAKILILDSKNSFAKQQQFQLGWQRRYPGMIEWVPLDDGGRVIAVEANKGIVHTEVDEFKPDIANIIPPQQAGTVAKQAGLTDSTGWCPVDQQSFESTLIPGIHVIGDSSRAGMMPKSAYAANVQGKVCAHAVAALLQGEPLATPSFLNTCYSLLAPDYAISVAAVYQLKEGVITPVKGAGGVTPLGASEEDLALEAHYAQGWYKNIIADSFR